jgi:hypothetical protein
MIIIICSNTAEKSISFDLLPSRGEMAADLSKQQTASVV